MSNLIALKHWLELFVAQSFALMPIEGDYIMRCEPNDAAHATIELDFQDNRMIQQRTTFGDFACSEPMLQTRWEWEVRYPAAGKIDMIYKSQVFTPLYPQMVYHLNRTSYCGYSDWQVNVGKELLGRTCNDYLMPLPGAEKYQIYRTDGDNLVLGEDLGERDGTTEVLRPDQLRLDQVFQRVE